tara:strand:+ start:404 stop:589 length:186 start_codon:yes stop_codon:yes gene_type:complete
VWQSSEEERRENKEWAVSLLLGMGLVKLREDNYSKLDTAERGSKREKFAARPKKSRQRKIP